MGRTPSLGMPWFAWMESCQGRLCRRGCQSANPVRGPPSICPRGTIRAVQYETCRLRAVCETLPSLAQSPGELMRDQSLSHPVAIEHGSPASSRGRLLTEPPALNQETARPAFPPPGAHHLRPLHDIQSIFLQGLYPPAVARLPGQSSIGTPGNAWAPPMKISHTRPPNPCSRSERFRPVISKPTVENVCKGLRIFKTQPRPWFLTQAGPA